MDLSRFTSLVLHRKTFWVALALWFAGSVVSETIWIGTSEFGFELGLTGLGNLLIMTLILTSMAVILRSAYEGWRYGYAEGLVGR